MNRRDSLRLGSALLASAFLPAALSAAEGKGMGELKRVGPDALKGLALPAALPLARALEALRGKAVLLNFWSSWCPPCREEMPLLQKLAQRYRDRPFAIQTVAVADRRKEAEDFLWDNGVTLPLLLDPEQDLLKSVGGRVLPTTWLLDAGLRPRWQVVGPLEWESPATLSVIEKLIPKA